MLTGEVGVSTVTFIIGTNIEGEQEKRERLAGAETENITMVEDMEAETGGLNMTEMVDNIAVIFFSLEYFMRETSESDVWVMI